jgi:hypothetical protein
MRGVGNLTRGGAARGNATISWSKQNANRRRTDPADKRWPHQEERGEGNTTGGNALGTGLGQTRGKWQVEAEAEAEAKAEVAAEAEREAEAVRWAAGSRYHIFNSGKLVKYTHIWPGPF